jgi:ferredoxin
MSPINPIYVKLAEKMNAPKSQALPRLLKKIANLEQARIANELPGTAESVAGRLNLGKTKVEKQLRYLFERGLVTPGKTGWNMVNNIGIFKDRVGSADPKYDDNEIFDLAQDMSLEDIPRLKARIERGDKVPPQRQVMRVVPKWRSIKDIPGVMPCEDAREVLKRTTPLLVHRCPCKICYRDRACKGRVPTDTCFSIGPSAQRFIDRGVGKQLTYKEAVELLDKLDDFNLVNFTGNSNRMPEAFCACCNDCCGLFVRAAIIKPLINQLPYAKSRFEVEDNPKACIGCGTCVERCPVHAITIMELKSGKKRSVTDIKECIGCGICVIGCPQNARKMKLVRPLEHIPDFTMGLDQEGLDRRPANLPKPQE